MTFLNSYYFLKQITKNHPCRRFSNHKLNAACSPSSLSASSSLSSPRGMKKRSGIMWYSSCLIFCLSSLWMPVCRFMWWITSAVASSMIDVSLYTNVKCGLPVSPSDTCSCLWQRQIHIQ